MIDQANLVALTADVVSAYVSNNTVHSSELGQLIQTIFSALSGVSAPKPVEEVAPSPKPAVPIRKSITDDYIISLEDGRRLKSMKRYLFGLGMTPADYRAKWGLPNDYPMVAPGYTARRSELAKASGLGNIRREAKAEIDTAAPLPASAEADAAPEKPAPKRRGRPKKVAAEAAE